MSKCNQQSKKTDGYEDVVSALRSIPEREFRDISGEVMKAIARRRLLMRCAFASLASAAAAILVVLMVPSVSPKSGLERVAAINGTVVLPSDWLVSAQEADGTWNPAHWGGSVEYIPAVTGFAMMSLVSHEGAASDVAVSKAAQAFRAMQTAGGRVGAATERSIFNHGIATVALLKLYETGRFPELFTVVDGAVNHIRETQKSSGGWGGGDGVSADIWMVDALARASVLGWQDKGGHLRRGIRRLETVAAPFSGEIAAAKSLSQKREVVEGLCGKWIEENPVARAGGMVYAKSVAAL